MKKWIQANWFFLAVIGVGVLLAASAFVTPGKSGPKTWEDVLDNAVFLSFLLGVIALLLRSRCK